MVEVPGLVVSEDVNFVTLHGPSCILMHSLDCLLRLIITVLTTMALLDILFAMVSMG